MGWFLTYYINVKFIEMTIQIISNTKLKFIEVFHMLDLIVIDKTKKIFAEKYAGGKE